MKPFEQAFAEMSSEQRRRVEIFERYDTEWGPVREARNAAIAEHEKEWREKAVQFMRDQEARRASAVKEYEAKGLSPGAAYAAVAFDFAREFEDHIIEKDAAARALDDHMQKPKAWRKWLEELNEREPGDPVVESLLRECSQCDIEAAVDGFLKSPPPERLLSELVMQQEGEAVAFKRGTTTVFRDVGNRLDVQRTDARDIEAALRVAAQKFDTDKGLLLTGDTAFKTAAAEIAGRMGLPLRNVEPEVLYAWERGRRAAMGQQLTASPRPSVERGIEGEKREPGADLLKGAQIVEIDERWGRDTAAAQALERAGLRLITAGSERDPTRLMMADRFAVDMPADRKEAAYRTMRGLPRDVLQALAQTDWSNPAAVVVAGEAQRKVLVERQLVDERGQLTPAGLDVILVRDEEIVRMRQDPKLHMVLARDSKTSAEFVREMMGELVAQPSGSRAQEAAQEAEQKQEARELPVEEKQFERSPKRNRQHEIEIGF